MKKIDFLDAVYQKLLNAGVSDEIATAEIKRLNDAIAKIEGDEVKYTVDQTADGIVAALISKGKVQPVTDTTAPSPEESDPQVSTDEIVVETVKEVDATCDDAPDGAKPAEDAPGDDLDDLFGGIEIEITPVPVAAPTAEESIPETVESTEGKTEDKEEEKTEELSADPAPPEAPTAPSTQSEVEKKEETASPTPASSDTTPVSEVEAPEAKTESADEESAESEETPCDTDDEDGEIVEPKKRGIGILPTKVKDNKSKKSKSKRKVGPQKNKALFWVLLCIAIPIIIMLAAVVVTLYVAFWVILALLMVFSIAALIVIVAAGALVSLIGIVYGVVQIVTGQVPVGLFEVGLGVVVGSAVMIVGILVYNFAVRLIPFAMKKLTSLLPIIFKKGRAGYEALKGVIENI